MNLRRNKRERTICNKNCKNKIYVSFSCICPVIHIKLIATFYNIKESLSDSKTEMAQLNEIDVDSVKYKMSTF